MEWNQYILHKFNKIEPGSYLFCGPSDQTVVRQYVLPLETDHSVVVPGTGDLVSMSDQCGPFCQ